MKSVLFVSTFLCFSAGALAHENILLVGGGTSPLGLDQLIQSSGGPSSSVLLITWPSDTPDTTFGGIRARFDQRSPHPATVVQGVHPDQLNTPEGQERLRLQLNQASAIYFSGGDQELAMKVLRDHPWITEMLKRKLSEGTPIGGTSAGMAIFSDVMMNGDEADWSKYWTEKGAGLLPKNIIVAHKFGESGELGKEVQLHDCGIVYSPQHPYLICVMTKGKDFKNLENVIRSISKIAYERLTS